MEPSAYGSDPPPPAPHHQGTACRQASQGSRRASRSQGRRHQHTILRASPLPASSIGQAGRGLLFGKKCALGVPVRHIPILHATASSPQGMQTGPSTQHAACDYAARCVNNRSALQWRLQRAAFLGAKCSGNFQGTEECSAVGVPQPYPERSAARCIMFRSYAKPPRDI